MKNKTAILFPGQGSQAVGMGKDLAEKFHTAREVFQKIEFLAFFGLKMDIFFIEKKKSCFLLVLVISF